MPLAYCVAVYILSSRYYSGQGSKGYRLMCISDSYLRREWGIKGHHEYELLKSHSSIISKQFRDEVAYYLKALRKHRHTL